jgi:uncharacterized membrane protein
VYLLIKEKLISQLTIFIMQSAIRYGLILGLITVILSVFSYLMGADFQSTTYSILSAVLSIGLIIFVCYRIKKETKGILSYGKATQLLFISFMISVIIGSFYTYVFNQYIDSQYAEVMEQKAMKQTEVLFEKIASSEEEADKMIEEARNDMQKRKESPFLYTLQTIMIASVVVIVVSLLAAIFVQRKPREDDFLYEDEIIDK